MSNFARSIIRFLFYFMKKGLNILGLILVIVGIFIIIIQPFSMTGAVIDISTSVSRIWFFVGVGAIVGGIIILVSYKVRDLEEIMDEDKGREIENEVVYVVDSSAAIDYKRDIQDLVDTYDGRVFVPKRILNEIKKNKKLMDKFRNDNGELKIKYLEPKENLENYRSLRHLARDVLEKTKKHQDYLIMKTLITEDGTIPKGITNKQLQKYEDRIENELSEKLKKEKKNFRRAPTDENKLWLLKKEYRVSKGDVDVLTTALYNAGESKKTRVLAHDTHLRDAITELKEGIPELEPYLDYIHYREYEKAA